VRRFIISVLTGPDGVTFDIARVNWAMAMGILFAMTIYTVVWQGHDWRPMEFATSTGSLLVLGGFGVAVKSKAEPPAPTNGGSSQ
jgi:hypothetical protein